MRLHGGWGADQDADEIEELGAVVAGVQCAEEESAEVLLYPNLIIWSRPRFDGSSFDRRARRWREPCIWIWGAMLTWIGSGLPDLG